MAIDPLAMAASKKGGVLFSEEKNYLFESNPDNFDASALPDTEYNLLDPLTSPDQETIEVAATGRVSSAISRLFSPRKNIFGKSMKKLDELIAMDPEEAKKQAAKELREAERPPAADPTPSDPVIDELAPNAEQIADDVAQGEIPATPQNAATSEAVENTRTANQSDNPDPNFVTEADQADTPVDLDGPYERGTIPRDDGLDVSEVMQSLKKPALPDPDGMLTDFRAIGAKGDEKIPNEDNVYAAIETISEQYSSQITEETRGQVTLEATRQLADLVGSSPDSLAKAILQRQRGQVIMVEGQGLAETMLAARDLLVAEAKKLDDLAAKAEFGSPEDVLAFREQFEFVGQLQMQIKGAQTELARALGGYRIPARADGPDLTQRDAAQLLDDLGGVQNGQDLARAYLQVGSRSGRLQLSRQTLGKRLSSAFYEVWINALVSNPITHTKNVVGGLLAITNHGLETLVAGTYGTARRALTGQAGGVYLGEFNAEMFGLVMSLREAFSAAGKSFVHGEKFIPGTKIQSGIGDRRPEFAFSGKGMGVKIEGMPRLQGGLSTIIDVLGNFLTLGRVPTRALEFEDTFFKVLAYRGAVYQQAYSKGMAAGKRGDALADYIANYVFNPPQVGIETAEAQAKYFTLQTKMDNFGRALQEIRRFPLIRWTVPFLNTPYNATKYAFIDRTPIGVFYGETSAALKRGAAPGASKQDRHDSQMAGAKIALGSAAALMFYMMASSGELTGRGPANANLRAALRRSGWQPYALRRGDTYFSIMGAEPISSTAMLAADIAETINSGFVDDATSDELIAALQAAVANQITQKTFMSGFAGMLATLNDPARYAESMQTDFVRSMVPRVVALAEKESDPIVRAARTRLESIQAQIPGWSVSLPAEKNLWGMDIAYGGSYGPNWLSPIYTSVYGPNQLEPNKEFAKKAFEIDQEFLAKGVRYAPGKHPESFPIPGMGAIAFTPNEKEKYHQYAGARMVEFLYPFVTSQAFKDLKNVSAQGDELAREEIVNGIQTLATQARAAAYADILNDKTYGEALQSRIERYADLKQQQAEQFQQRMQ